MLDFINLVVALLGSFAIGAVLATLTADRLTAADQRRHYEIGYHDGLRVARRLVRFQAHPADES